MSDREELHRGFALESLGRELTTLAGQMQLDPALAPERLVQSLVTLLTAGYSPILIGRDGSGKRTAVEALATRIAVAPDGLPDLLRKRRILECDPSAFQNGCLYAHEFETRIESIAQKCRESKTMLFLHQIHLAVKAGMLAGYEDRTVATLLTPSISRKEITLIGATTPEGYRTIMRHNSRFAACLTPVEVPEQTAEETLALLQRLRRLFVISYQIRIHPASLTEIIRMTRFYGWQSFPGKAFVLLKAALAEKALAKTLKPGRRPLITVQDIQALAKTRTGLPSFLLFREEPVQRHKLIAHLKTQLFDQDQAIEAVVDAILIFKVALNDPGRPVGSFLFTGPTGVGKTELVKLVAETVFGSRGRVLRYDGGEYADAASVARLVGEGREEGSGRRLVEEVLAQPFSVILFDEIEKAHPSLFSLLLPVLGEGRLTDVSGRTASFSNALIIMTSNLGSDLYGQSQRPIGLLPSQADGKDGEVHKAILRRIQGFFSPEFLNRLTKIVHFEPLSRAAVRRVAEKAVYAALRRPGVQDLKLRVSVEPSVFDALMQRGYDPQYGARPMERAVQELIVSPLATVLATGGVASGERAVLTYSDGQPSLSFPEQTGNGKGRGEHRQAAGRAVSRIASDTMGTVSERDGGSGPTCRGGERCCGC
jgi:ATP-dependent Clp protease ATP-binding subunit ClpC